MALSQEQFEGLMTRFTALQKETVDTMTATMNATLQQQQQTGQQNTMAILNQLLDKQAISSRESAAAAAQAAATIQGSAENYRNPRASKGDRQLDSKHFTRVDKFDGGEASWNDWKNDM